MPTIKTTSELRFLKISANHYEFANSLRELHIPETAVLASAKDIAAKWFHLAEDHLKDAQCAHGPANLRSAYSRAYYAAYNASKAVRYMANGRVSLRGDDHEKASELPDGFENVAMWSKAIIDLYKDRLLADYDNWDDTLTNFARSPKEAITLAEDFLIVARALLISKYKVAL